MGKIPGVCCENGGSGCQRSKNQCHQFYGQSRGKPANPAYPLAVEANKHGIEQIVHFTAKDKNRTALDSELFALARSGIKNLPVMTGDYPTQGYEGRPKPIFDLDAVNTLKLIENLSNRGNRLTHRGPELLHAMTWQPIKKRPRQPASFCAAASRPVCWKPEPRKK